MAMQCLTLNLYMYKSLCAVKFHVIFAIATGVVPSRSGNFNSKSDTHYEFAKVRVYDGSTSIIALLWLCYFSLE